MSVGLRFEESRISVFSIRKMKGGDERVGVSIAVKKRLRDIDAPAEEDAYGPPEGGFEGWKTEVMATFANKAEFDSFLSKLQEAGERAYGK